MTGQHHFVASICFRIPYLTVQYDSPFLGEDWVDRLLPIELGLLEHKAPKNLMAEKLVVVFFSGKWYSGTPHVWTNPYVLPSKHMKTYGIVPTCFF